MTNNAPKNKNIAEKIQGAACVELGLFEEKKNRRKVNGNRGIERERNKQKSIPISAFYNKIVRLSEEPIIVDNVLPRDCRITNGWFTITYNPSGSPKLVRGKPYTIGQDLIRGRFCVSGVKHWKALCERIPEFAFIKKWSNFNQGLFALAKQHPGVAFGFNLNWVEYAEMIERKAEEQGIDIDHKPFFVYKTKKEDMEKLSEQYKVYPNPVKEDYQTVLDNIDKEMK